MVKLSFIVPVYNVASYLRKCVYSLVDQDFSDYEIVLIDDGSTDESGKICDELSESISDERLVIRVLHQKNGGLSAARNTGIKAAKGEYLCFVDSDDYWEKNVLGGLMKQVERENLDVLRFNYQNVRLKNEGEYEVFQPNKDPKRDVDYREEVTDGETFLNERLGPACYAVMFIVKRSLICKSRTTLDATHLEPEVLDPMDIDNSCLFKEGIYFEDVDWTPRMLCRAKRVASTKNVVYNYLWREGSITLPDNPKKREKVMRDKIALIREFKEQQKMVKDKSWFLWMTSVTAMSILNMLTFMSSGERKPYLKELNSLRIFPLSIKRERMLSHKMKIIIANVNPAIYCYLMSLRK